MTGKRGREKGLGKVAGSGRTKGVPNATPKAVVVKTTLLEACAHLNFDPLAELIAVLGKLDPDAKARTLLGMFPYIWAQMKAPETQTPAPFQMFATMDRETLLRAAMASQSIANTPIQASTAVIEDDE